MSRKTAETAMIHVQCVCRFEVISFNTPGASAIFIPFLTVNYCLFSNIPSRRLFFNLLTVSCYNPIIPVEKTPKTIRQKINSSSSDALNSCPDNQHEERKSDLTEVQPRIRTSCLKIKARSSMGGTRDRIPLDMLSGRPMTVETWLIFKIPPTIEGLLVPSRGYPIFIKRLRG